MKFLDISDVAIASGLPASTLRYYEEKGLITSIYRHGLRRQYDPRVLDRLALINMARAGGFLLSDIAQIFGPNNEVAIPREDLRMRADTLERKAQEIKALAAMMRHVADCPAPSHMECPTFRKLLRMGTRHQSRIRRQNPKKHATLSAK